MPDPVSCRISPCSQELTFALASSRPVASPSTRTWVYARRRTRNRDRHPRVARPWPFASLRWRLAGGTCWTIYRQPFRPPGWANTPRRSKRVSVMKSNNARKWASVSQGESHDKVVRRAMPGMPARIRAIKSRMYWPLVSRRMR